MKFRVLLKDPDGFGFIDAVSEAAEKSMADTSGLSDDERDTLAGKRVELLNEFMNNWVEYGEYVTIEFDTDAGTAIVVNRS